MQSKRYIIISFFLCALAMLKAQEGLEISKLFEQYGKAKGITMVELKNKKFENLKFSLFKSITIAMEQNTEAAGFARKCIEKDQKNAQNVKQVLSNGIPQSVFLILPKTSKINRLILFNELKRTDKKIVVVYIESNTDAETLLNSILNQNNN